MIFICSFPGNLLEHFGLYLPLLLELPTCFPPIKILFLKSLTLYQQLIKIKLFGYHISYFMEHLEGKNDVAFNNREWEELQVINTAKAMLKEQELEYRSQGGKRGV